MGENYDVIISAVAFQKTLGINDFFFPTR